MVQLPRCLYLLSVFVFVLDARALLVTYGWSSVTAGEQMRTRRMQIMRMWRDVIA
jgi:hypothetical protein